MKGKAVIKKLSQRLTVEYGRGYNSANLFRMLKVYEYYPDVQKFSALSAKLKNEALELEISLRLILIFEIYYKKLKFLIS